jgi:hypothetical protein
MTIQNKATLKGYFNTGDRPTEAQFADLVDTVMAFLSGTSANRPGSPNTGEIYFDTTIGKPIWYNGADWVNADGNVEL